MRSSIVFLALASSLALCLPGCVGDQPAASGQSARDSVDYSALPPASDTEALSALNQRQRRLLRRSERACTAQVEGALSASGCIMSRTDSAIAAENDPALTAFHFALPPRQRYDPERPPSVGLNVHQYVPVSASE